MKKKRILMVASENDGVSGGKVGGIGDVVRDAPVALAQQGWDVAVVTPSYGFLHKSSGSRLIGSVRTSFRGMSTDCDLYSVHGKRSQKGLQHLVIDHPTFLWCAHGRPQIYCNDPQDRPFAFDASKYALFCRAVADAILQQAIQLPGCLHLHDWHSAFLLILRKYDRACRPLLDIPSVYTIHNVALQGVRPFAGDPSSLEAWYPDLAPHLASAPDLADPRWPNCVNPMAVGVRLADRVHAVSPSYADEICIPSDPPRHYGGEGLEADLSRASQAGRLFGILNGCAYPEDRAVQKRTWVELIQGLRANVLQWIGNEKVESAAHIMAMKRLTALAKRKKTPSLVATSVTRVVDQKVFLLQSLGSTGKSGLQAALEAIGNAGVYILLGTGDPIYEQFLLKTSAENTNFVFMNGYSDASATELYANGDLFLMPSSFEPCGISQMIAMRDGQPCVVHGVGGLKDTVKEGINGFVFDGNTVEEQVDAFANACLRAVDLKKNNPPAWNRLRDAAEAERFLWQDTVSNYIEHLYDVTIQPRFCS